LNWATWLKDRRGCQETVSKNGELGGSHWNSIVDVGVDKESQSVGVVVLATGEDGPEELGDELSESQVAEGHFLEGQGEK
jgi:hypothetical protein